MVDSKVVRIEEDLLPIIRRYSDGGISDGVRTMHKIIVEKEEKRLSLEDVSVALRKVVQVEGVVMLGGKAVPEHAAQPVGGVSLEQVEGAVRKVTQTEGIMLHSQQKQFFREIFASLTQCISDKGLMRK